MAKRFKTGAPEAPIVPLIFNLGLTLFLGMGVRNLFLASCLARFLKAPLAYYASADLLHDVDFAYTSLKSTSAQFRFYKVKGLLRFNPPKIEPASRPEALSTIDCLSNGRIYTHYALGLEPQLGVVAHLPHITSSPIPGASSLKIYNDNYRRTYSQIVLNQIHRVENIRTSQHT